MTFAKIGHFYAGTPSSPNVTLARALDASASDDTIYFSKALPITATELAALATSDLIRVSVTSTGRGDTKAGYTEIIEFTKANYDSSNKKATSITRAVDADGSQDTALLGAFNVGDRVDSPITATEQGEVRGALTGSVATGANSLQIGDGTATEQLFKVNQGLANDSGIGFDASGNPIVYLANGSSFVPGAGAGSISGGDGIDVTASVISADIASGNDLLKITSGEIDTNLTATKTEIDQLAGTTNIAEADTFFGSTDISGAEAETLTDGSNADTEHRHGIVTDTTVTVGSTTTETALFSQSIPANMLGADGGIIVDIMLSDYNAVSRDLTIRLKYGSTTVASFTMSDTSASTGYSGYIKAKLFGSGATNSQKGVVQMMLMKEQTLTPSSAGCSIQTGVGTAAEDSTGALTLSITAQWNSTGTQGITAYGGDLRYI